MTYDEYQTLLKLQEALQFVQTHGPKYIRPTYIANIPNAIGNVQKQLDKGAAEGLDQPMPFIV